MGEHLMHGWEPDTPAEDSLLRRFVLASGSHTRFLAEACGGRAPQWGGLSAADAAPPLFFEKAAGLLRPPQYTDLEDVLARLREFYPPERHWTLLSAWPTPDLSGHGFELMGHPPFM